MSFSYGRKKEIVANHKKATIFFRIYKKSFYQTGNYKTSKISNPPRCSLKIRSMLIPSILRFLTLSTRISNSGKAHNVIIVPSVSQQKCHSQCLLVMEYCLPSYLNSISLRHSGKREVYFVCKSSRKKIPSVRLINISLSLIT